MVELIFQHWQLIAAIFFFGVAVGGLVEKAIK